MFIDVWLYVIFKNEECFIFDESTNILLEVPTFVSSLWMGVLIAIFTFQMLTLIFWLYLFAFYPKWKHCCKILFIMKYCFQ